MPPLLFARDSLFRGRVYLFRLLRSGGGKCLRFCLWRDSLFRGRVYLPRLFGSGGGKCLRFCLRRESFFRGRVYLFRLFRSGGGKSLRFCLRETALFGEARPSGFWADHAGERFSARVSVLSEKKNRRAGTARRFLCGQAAFLFFLHTMEKKPAACGGKGAPWNILTANCA